MLDNRAISAGVLITEGSPMTGEESFKQELAADGTPSGVEEEAYAPYPFDSEKISISQKRISLSNLVRRLARGLIKAAEVQRGDNLWDIGKQSRLIESLMLRIPLPLFYAAADKDDNLVIVDGLQRASTIKRYVLEQKFKLESLEFLRELSGKKFDALPDRMKIRIEETELDFVIINPDSPQEVQRNIFKRLNTGGLPLNEQEIRHALYHGPCTTLLKELADTPEFKEATAKSVNDTRMAAQELVLRYIAFSTRGVGEYLKNDEMDSYLCDTMQAINSALTKRPGRSGEKLADVNISEKRVEELRGKFLAAMRRASKLFDNYAFRISTPLSEWRTPINKSLFEVWSVLLSEMDEYDFQKLLSKRDELFDDLKSELEERNSNLRRFIGQDSLKVSGVKGRHTIIGDIVKKLVER
jgi:hypothetical protein